jgi:tRNA (guanine10-N2)-dimethyltransferase
VRVWIELSGEHPTLPRAEALGAFEAEGVEVREASWSSKVLRLDAVGPVPRAAGRLGLAHVVCEELASGSLEDLRDFARSLDLAGRTFRTRARALDVDLDRAAVEGALGADFGKTGRVDLTSPSIDFRVLVGDEFLLGRVLHRVDRHALETRTVTHRSFRLPISLHPKLARALVNLSRVPMGGLLADPFCGTGGILLEAAQIGLRPVAADVRRNMVVGARKSLRALDADSGYLVADAGRGPWKRGRLLGIATDPPYGRASSSRGEPVLDLYDRAFRSFADALPTGRFVAIVLPTDEAVAVGERHLELIERHTMRVHRSLVRNFCVYLR